MHIPALAPRRLTGMAAIACTAALAAVAALAATAWPVTAATAGMPGCSTSGLVVWMDTEGSAGRAAGHAGQRCHRLRGVAIQQRGHQQQRAAAVRPGDGGGLADLPAGPDRGQGRAVPAEGLHEQRDLHGRPAGAAGAACVPIRAWPDCRPKPRICMM